MIVSLLFFELAITMRVHGESGRVSLNKVDKFRFHSPPPINLTTQLNDMSKDWKSTLHFQGFTDPIVLLVISAIFLFSLILVQPTGNFPLGDDWSYGLTVRHFVETGEFRPTGWTSMPLVTQAIWGYLFCIPFGFSFEALRLSTLTLSLAGIFGSYYLIKELHPSRWLAFVVAMTLAFNPIYYTLSNTFMTDVPFTAITIFAAIFYVRNLKSDSYFDLLIGTVFAVAATLTRQLSLAIPIAFAVAFIIKNKFSARHLIIAILPSLLCLGVLLLFQYWLTATGRLPALYNVQGKELLSALGSSGIVFKVIGNAFLAMLYLGWFLLPVLIFNTGNIFENVKAKTGLWFAITVATFIFLALTAFAWFSGFHIPSPHQGNTIHTAGIGALTLRDTYFLRLNHVAALPSDFWVLMTIAALIGATILVLAIPLTAKYLWATSQNKNNSGLALTCFVLLSVTIYMIPLVIGGFLDRYLVPVIPFAAAGIAILSARLTVLSDTKLLPRHIAPALAVVFFFVFTTCGTHDYFAWNQARWAALNDLTRNRLVSPADMDGGFEFNGLNLYEPGFRTTRDKSWWWVHNDTYQLAFGAVPGYSIIKEYPYKKWIPLGEASIYLLQKNSFNLR